MGLQEEWNEAESSDETIKVKETLFIDDLTRLYHFESKKYPHMEIEVFESSKVLTVRYIEKGE